MDTEQLSGFDASIQFFTGYLVFLLAYIGVKMLLVHHHPIPNVVSLAVIGGILAVGILASSKVVGNAAALISPLAHDIESLFVTSYRQARRAVILLVGSSVLVIGIAMVFFRVLHSW